MSRPLRIAALILGAALLLLGLAFAVFYVLSPPNAGQPIAKAWEIPHPTVAAHRGASSWAPESTRPAYELARASYDGLGPVTLRELIEIAERGNNNPGLYLETKDAAPYPGIEEDILTILEEAGWYPEAPSLEVPDPGINEQFGAASVHLAAGPARVIFQSFHAPSVEELVERAPDLPTVYLISRGMAEADGFTYHLDRAVDMGAAGVGPVGVLGYPWHTGAAHRRGLLVHHYTINDPWQMRLLRRFGADGIFTDRPDVALEVLGLSDGIDVDTLLERLGY